MKQNPKNPSSEKKNQTEQLKNKLIINPKSQMKKMQLLQLTKSNQKNDSTSRKIKSNLTLLVKNRLYALMLVLGCLASSELKAQNDFCSGAIPVTCGSTVSGTTIGATIDAGLPAACNAGGYSAGSVWYVFTGNGQDVIATLCNPIGFDSRMTVFSGTCGSLTCVGANDDDFSCGSNPTTSTVTFSTAIGTDYYIMVHGYSSSTGAFVLTTTCVSPCTHPVNDNCTSAESITITSGTTCSPVGGNNTCNSASLSNPSCDPFSVINDNWYTATTGNCNSNLTVHITAGTAVGLRAAVYTGTCGSMTQVFCTASISGPFSLSGITPNTTYFIQVYTTNSTPGSYTICINQNDVTPPVTPILPNIVGQCSAIVSPPTTTDNCSGTITGTTPSPLTYLSQGSSTITWTFTDASGNSTTANQTVTVLDNTAPTKPILADQIGECSVTVTAPQTTDNCAGTVTGTTLNPLTYTVQGSYVIIWTFTDNNGNSSTTNQNVIVHDVTAPVPNMATLPDLTGECSVTVSSSPTATDNCVGSVTGTTTDPTSYSVQGSYVITWTYNDGNGNTSSQTQNVIVHDVTPPVANMGTLPDLTGECSVTVLSSPTATDNCVGSVTGTTTDPTSYSVQGSYVITWTYNDGNGNTSTQTQNVMVTDVTAPVADMGTLPDLTGECSVTVLSSPTATDNCVGSVTGTTTDPTFYSAQGSYVITWTYNDGNGNTSTQTQNVIVADVTAPVADMGTLPDLTGECSVTVSSSPTATDNCVGSVTGTTTDPTSYSVQGSYVITWSYNDGNGNTSTQTQNVMVTDVTAPVADMATLPDLTGECSVTVSSSPTATDNCVGSVTGTTTDPTSYSVQGSYVITWSYNDGNGNTSTQTQNVMVTDVTAPVADMATLPDLTGECSVTVLSSPTATDNCVGSVTGTTTDPTSYSVQGSYVITWTYNDGNGNTSTQTQNVMVTDVTAPVADMATLPDLTGECSVTVLSSPTATDNCVGSVTGTTTDPTSYSVQGSYVITWTYNDGNGNTSTQTQNVMVTDVTAPVADMGTLPDLTGQCSVTVLSSPTATDNCVGSVTGTTTDPTSYSVQGSYVITWTYNDGNGNTSTQTQNVMVTDVTAPVADMGTLPDLTGECSVTVLSSPTATDNCVGSVTGTTTDPTSYSAQGSYVITWTYNDGNGNTSTQTQNVIVADVTAPVADMATLPDLTGECSVTVLSSPTATDNCVGSVTGTTTDPTSYSVQGSYLITWTYNDGNGNTSTQTQNVIVADVTAPITPVLANVSAECSVIVPIATTTDNCVGTVTGTTTDALTYTTQGTHVITWTFNDGNGNSTTATQNVIITDVTAPLIAAPADITVCSLTPGVTVSLGTPTVSDNCGSVTYINNAPLTFGFGTTVVIWTANDGHGNTSTATQNVTVTQTPVGSASNVVICNGNPANVPLNSTIAGTTFTWTAALIVPGVVGFTSCSSNCGTTIQDVLTNTGNVHGVVEYTVTPSSQSCAGATFTVDVTVGAPPAAPVISGPTVVCTLTTATYSVVLVPEATTYTWTVPTGVTGMTILSGQGTNTIVVNCSAGTIIGNITCTASNSCGSSTTTSLGVTKKPAMPTPIQGPTSTCGQTSATYFTTATFGATSYSWIVPAGMSIVSGQGTTQVNVSMTSSFISGSIIVAAVNACGNVPGTTLFITGNVPGVPGGSITGPAIVCGLSSATYSIPVSPGTTGSLWTISGAGTINGSNTGYSVNVNLNGTVGGTIMVSGTNLCGTGPSKTLVLITAAVQPGAISGPANTCGIQTANYSVVSLGAGYTYNWQLPAYMVMQSGQGTNSITVGIVGNTGTVQSSGGTIKVSSTNACGNTSALRTMGITRCADPIAMNGSSEEISYSDIYPNPASNQFTIDITAMDNVNVNLEIYNVLGEKVQSTLLQQQQSIVDISSLQKGMYLVRITDSNNNILSVQRLVKE